MEHLAQTIAQAAAAWVVDEGLDYGPAKKRALKQLGLPPRTPLPDNDTLEAAVREHLALFHADTQPAELHALRLLALGWMERLQAYQPLVGGAVWRGTATRLNDVVLHLFSDDPKAVELSLIDRGVAYEAHAAVGLQGQDVPALSVRSLCEPLQQWVQVHLLVNDTVAQRGSLLPDAQGRKPRGSIQAMRAVLEAAAELQSPGR